MLFTSLIYFLPDKFSYIVIRLKSFFDREKSGTDQSSQATEAIREGSLKGQGMGEGILKEKVPEAHTDYVIAVISEEFGSIISILIISIFLFISFRVIKRIINLNNNFYKLALSGLISLLIFQTFIHIGVNANLLPTTGMTLPFLSYGGSSLLSSGIIAGIILNYTSLGSKRLNYVKKNKIIIATGGTGGHVFPAVSLSDSLRNNFNIKIFSDKRGLKYFHNLENVKVIYADTIFQKIYLKQF